jgi:SAM-dependent methyltransferase
VFPQSGTRATEAERPIAAHEAFKPIPVRRCESGISQLAFCVRQFVDLQLLTCVRFLRPRLARLNGKVLDVGCGEMPFRGFLARDVEYQGIDVPEAVSFGMRNHPEIALFDGLHIPFPDNSWDGILCTEVLEHTYDPETLVAEMLRVLRPGGTLLLTVPFAARVHHAPHDYQRFTRFGLRRMFSKFDAAQIFERGNDYSVIANKLIVLNARVLADRNWLKRILILPVVVFVFGPLAGLALVAAHVSMLLDVGSKDDPLGYGCVAKKRVE